MRKVSSLALALLLVVSTVAPVFAQVWVNPYVRKDGTYVDGHRRSEPDHNPYNNWDFPGNVNPYTGRESRGNPDTYLDRYRLDRHYQNPSSNPYRSGYPSFPRTRSRW